MNLEPTPEQEALRDTVRRCLADEAPIADHVRPIADGATWSPDQAWKQLADVGATGILVPAALGGGGASLLEATVIAEELGRGLYPGPWLAAAVAAPRVLAGLGEPAPGSDAAELLGAIADGRATAAVALQAATGEQAVPGFRAAGDRVSGGEARVLGAPLASVVLVRALSGDGRHGLYAVDPGADGVEITPEPALDRTVSVGRVELSEARARRLGPADPDAFAAARDDVLVAAAADALGCAAAMLDVAVDYAKVRHQFGQPIGAFQAVQHLCVDMLETVELTRGGVLHAAWAAGAGDPGEAHVAAVRAKASTDRLAAVGDTAIQVLGGIGYTWEHDAHLYLKRLLTWSNLLGTASDHRVGLGRHLVGSLS